MVHRVTPKGFIPHFVGYAFSLLTSDIKKAEKRKNDYKDQCFTQTGTPIIIYETDHSNRMRQFINLDSKNLKKKKKIQQGNAFVMFVIRFEQICSLLYL